LRVADEMIGSGLFNRLKKAVDMGENDKKKKE